MRKPKFPRLTHCLLISVVLFIAAICLQNAAPGNILAVTIYKAHMASMAGWIGYWLDRWLFPYSRPHVFMDKAREMAMMRRAIIVAACLIAVSLGA